MTRLAMSLLAAVVVVLITACTPIPAEVEGFETRCIEMTTEEIPPHEDDPHDGFKRVYACDITLDQLVDGNGQTIRPFPDGTRIIKASRRPAESFNWLVASAQKVNGTWKWVEWTRNFPDEELLQIPASEQLCIDCHRQVESADWIFSGYVSR